MADPAWCPVLRPTRKEFERPFEEFVAEVFAKDPDLPMFKVRAVHAACSARCSRITAARQHPADCMRMRMRARGFSVDCMHMRTREHPVDCMSMRACGHPVACMGLHGLAWVRLNLHPANLAGIANHPFGCLGVHVHACMRTCVRGCMCRCLMHRCVQAHELSWDFKPAACLPACVHARRHVHVHVHACTHAQTHAHVRNFVKNTKGFTALPRVHCIVTTRHVHSTQQVYKE